jgi:predicted acetyltransferase
MAVQVRPIREDELAAFFESMSTAFLERPDVEKVADEVRGLWDLNRTWAALDDGRICGTFRSWETELTVPGKARLPAAAVSGVTVLPTHRRRGVLRQMVAAEHAAIRERGEAIGLLYASEYPIYGRFGYGPGMREASWTVDARSAGDVVASRGKVEIAPRNEQTRDAIRAVYEERRMRHPGEIRRRDYHWDYETGLRESAWGPTWKGFLALHRNAAGEVDGYARYRSEEKWEHHQPRAIVNLDELHGVSDEAYADLWRFLIETDWVGTIKAERRTYAEPLPWLLANARAAELTAVGEGMWVRLFDVPRALEARAYERACSIVLELVDGEAPGRGIRVQLDADTTGATCRVSDRTPDLTIHISALGAAYLGDSPLSHAVLARGADEHRAGALRDADGLFRTLDVAWSSTFF